ncbi:MAG: membrane protein insertase YidC [Saprospiraceae bacterium]
MEEKQSNLSTYIGMGLIFLLLFFWMQYSAPPKPDQTAQQTAQQTTGTNADPAAAAPTPAAAVPAAAAAPPDSLQSALLVAKFGAFTPAATGQEQLLELENDLVKIVFTSKGGRIREIRLKKYDKINTDTAGNDIKSPVYLLEDAKNRFDFTIPVQGSAAGSVNTSELYFAGVKNGNAVTFRAPVNGGGYLEQSYTLRDGDYHIDYKIATVGMEQVFPAGQANLQLTWVNHLDKLEKNQQYERTMSTVYFKPNDKDPDYCNCRKNDSEQLGDQPVKWMAHNNQFFNTSIIAQDFSFRNFTGETLMLTDADPDLKILKTTAVLPVQNPNGGSLNMAIYSGPNEFKKLRAYDVSLEDIIPFGSSIFGAINRWVIRPMFVFLSGFIGSKGIVILMLTLLVKLLVYPLTYRMVHSQARMAALKPRMEELKRKHGDDQQAMSVETMKMYSEFGVNPLGGCFPILLQMPIWFALYRFFPAAIEFRQEGFLWAHDLSSYDVAFKLPFMMPGFGNHISAFTLIWVATTLWYTWYSMKQMDNSAMQNDQMKIMKYMQYFMPVMFMFFFNSFASGLTLYLCFSNILNIGQTVVTKRYLINHDKINVQLEKNRQKPKKETGFRARLEQAMKEQQRVQEERAKQQKKK